MSWTDTDRVRRQFQISKADQRKDFERDRDRIMYSSAFHRLAGVTQIVQAGELDIFHTRQQHTYKVAQIGRRLAERCNFEQRKEAELHGVNAEVVEAACLAHDLGHPPFGHAAEKTLNDLVVGEGDADGYEGNAQTFRILTKLAVRYGVDQCSGLDLTRATLAATLKYPWLRDVNDKKKENKWSSYKCERDAFEWVRQQFPNEHKTAEAQLMDWADDIAYSVHDLEDFHRVGIIPWTQILSDTNRDNLVRQTVESWFGPPADASAQIRSALDRLKEILLLFPSVTNESYDGSREQRRQLRNLTSLLIGRYVRSISLTDDFGGQATKINVESEVEVRLLKHLVRQYVISLPALHAQQYGQKRLITNLFEVFFDAAKSNKINHLPMRFRYILEDHKKDGPARLAADCVAMLTETEAKGLHNRYMGNDSSTVLDPMVR